VSTALATGCDAIHPGYGFLSERAEFAEICAMHDIKFIGPTAESMRKMGDKATARKTMVENNVPVTPGTGIVKSVRELKDFAHKAGYPIILKATAGGGGKGMRIVRNDSELETNMNLCMQEADKFFGNPNIYAEKYLENPRHIEVQIIGDSFGNVIHLGERDCSIQRRHQKLLEEAPSPAIDEETSTVGFLDFVCSLKISRLVFAPYRTSNLEAYLLLIWSCKYLLIRIFPE
jgi:acetyl-CoA carboxylase biotin carboxylase subunit